MTGLAIAGAYLAGFLTPIVLLLGFAAWVAKEG
jgi:hypothetical protein